MFRLAPYLLDPEPVELSSGKGEGEGRNRHNGPDGIGGKWSGEASRGAGFRTEDQVHLENLLFFVLLSSHHYPLGALFSWPYDNQRLCSAVG